MTRSLAAAGALALASATGCDGGGRASAATPPLAFAGATSATATSPSSVLFRWSPASGGGASPAQVRYLTFVATASGAEDFSTPSYVTAPGLDSYEIFGLLAGTTYYGVVRAQTPDGTADGNVVEVSATTPTPVDLSPPVFGGITSASPTGSQSVTLGWNAAVDDTTPQNGILYYVYESRTSYGQVFTAPSTVTPAGATSITIGGLWPGTTYHYVVRARDGAGNVDGNRWQASATTVQPVDTTAPTFAGVTALSADGPAAATAVWAAGSDAVTPAAALDYLVWLSTATPVSTTGPPTRVVTGATNTQFTGLSASTTYYALVRARDSSGNADANTVQASATTPATGDTTAPTFGGATGATAASPSQVTVTWNAASDNVSAPATIRYDLYLAATSGGQNFGAAPQATSPPGATSHQLQGLTPTVTYYIVVRARDQAGNRDANTVQVSATTLPPPDTTPPTFGGATAAVATGATAVTVSWSAASDNVTPSSGILYRIWQSTSSPVDTSGYPTYASPLGATLFAATLVASNSVYYFVVRAVDAAGNADNNTVTVSAVTPPAAADTTPPTFAGVRSAVASGPSSITLSWNAATDNTTPPPGIVYQVWWATASPVPTGGAPAAQTGLGATTSLHAGASPGTTYFYVVRAVDAAGNADTNSVEASAAAAADTAPPTAPGSLAVTGTSASSAGLSWTASTDNVTASGAIVYGVWWGTSAGVPTALPPPATTGAGATTHTVTGLSPGTTYYFRVRARDAATNWSADSNEPSGTTAADTTPPSAPGSLGVTGTSQTTASLSWTASSDNLDVPSALVYGVWWGTASPVSTTLPPPATTGAGTTAYTVTGLSAGTTYYFRVRARDTATNWSTDSNEATGATTDTTPPTAPGSLSATAAGSSSVNLAWTQSTDNVTAQANIVYRIYWSGTAVVSTAGAPMATVTGTGATTVTGLTPSTTYYFRVTARDQAGNISSDSNEPNATTQASSDTQPPTAPGSLAVTGTTTTTATLAWTQSTDNVTAQANIVYRIYWSGTAVVSTAGAPMATVTGTGATTVTGLTPSTTYYFRGTAQDQAGNISTDSNEPNGTTAADTTPPTAPGSLAVTGTTASTAGLSWTASTDNVTAPASLVYGVWWGTTTPVSTAGPPGATTGAGATAYTVTGLSPGTAYYFRVRARDAALNWSGDSNEATGTTAADTTPPTAPGSLAVTGTTASTAGLSWTASTDNVTAPASLVYGVWWGPTTPVSTAGPPGATTGAGATAHTVTGLSGGTAYYFRVRARDAALNWSGDSNEATGTTTADTTPPAFAGAIGTGLPAGTSATSLVLAWNAASDDMSPATAIVYRVWWSTTPGFVPGPTPNLTTAAGAVTATATGLAADTFHYFVVRAVDQAGNADTNSVQVAGRTRVSWTSHLRTLYDGSAANANCSCHNGGNSGFNSATYATTMASTGTQYGMAVVLAGQPFASPVQNKHGPASVPWSAAPDTTPPTAPGSVGGTAASSTAVTLTWTAGTDNVTTAANLRYAIFLSAVSGGQNWAVPEVVTAQGATSSTVAGLRPGTAYAFVVRAQDAWGNRSTNTAGTLVTTSAGAPADTTAPTAPTGVTATVANPGTITVAWTAASDNATAAGNLVYGIWVALGAAPSTATPPDALTAGGATSHLATHLDKWDGTNRTYTFIVRTRDEAGNWSANSTAASGTISGTYGTADNVTPLPQFGRRMPRGGPPFMTWQEFRRERDWIFQGALNN